MQICRVLAGFSLKDSDDIRRALGYYLARYYREIVDKPLREFGESPEKGNPEPSLGRNSSEGVTTNEYDPERIMNQHERGASKLQNKVPIFDIGGKFPPDIEWV